MTLTEPRFPILTLEEGSLTPALGYLFDRKWLYPYESLISILWKFEKANALSGNIVARLLGPDVDPYEGLVPHLDVIDIDRLRANLQVSRRSLRTALIQDAVRPRWSTSFRFCRLCLGYGYHSIVHQFESVNVCPAHRCAVESACRRCGHKIPYRINVQLLEAQYRCAKCLASYANVFWTPSRARPMKPGHRKAFTRRYMDRRRG